MVNLPDLDEADELITPPKGAYIMTCPMPVAAPADQTLAERSRRRAGRRDVSSPDKIGNVAWLRAHARPGDLATRILMSSGVTCVRSTFAIFVGAARAFAVPAVGDRHAPCARCMRCGEQAGSCSRGSYLVIWSKVSTSWTTVPIGRSIYPYHGLLWPSFRTGCRDLGELRLYRSLNSPRSRKVGRAPRDRSGRTATARG
jgi:hypothetical protein